MTPMNLYCPLLGQANLSSTFGLCSPVPHLAPVRQKFSSLFLGQTPGSLLMACLCLSLMILVVSLFGAWFLLPTFGLCPLPYCSFYLELIQVQNIMQSSPQPELCHVGSFFKKPCFYLCYVVTYIDAVKIYVQYTQILSSNPTTT